MSKDIVENYINNQKYNALQKKRPNGRWVSLSIPWLKSRDFRLGIIKTVDVTINDDNGGFIEYDPEQETWVFWEASETGSVTFGNRSGTYGEGVTYFKDLEETEDTIREELEDQERHNN